jgi:hypothetical protein
LFKRFESHHSFHLDNSNQHFPCNSRMFKQHSFLLHLNMVWNIWQCLMSGPTDGEIRTRTPYSVESGRSFRQF